MPAFYGSRLATPLMLGTAQYPSPAILAEAFQASGTEVATVSLRRESGGVRAGQEFWELIRGLGVRVLPNTAGCYSAKEAVTTAKMAREIFETSWVKLEVIGHADTLEPDVYGLVEAARILSEDGFEVFPYTTESLVVAERLVEAGCKVLMPWGSPIGSGLGLLNEHGLRGPFGRTSRTYRSSWMPVSDFHPTLLVPWNWDMTLFWSIRPWLVPGIRSQWRARFPRP